MHQHPSACRVARKGVLTLMQLYLLNKLRRANIVSSPPARCHLLKIKPRASKRCNLHMLPSPQAQLRYLNHLHLRHQTLLAPTPGKVSRTGWDQMTALPSAHHWASQVALVIKNLPANAGDVRDMGLIPGSRRCPGEENGNPLQYLCLENPMDRGAWGSMVRSIAKSQTQLK